MTQVWPIPVDHPDYYNPFLDKSRHPEFYTGWNSAAVNGDEMNGAGVNEPIWPNWFDSFEALRPVVLTAEMMSFFDEACPDLILDPRPNTVVFPPETRTLVLRRA